jgi:hypothetical protein
MSAYVRGFGCRPIATIGLAWGPSSESLQGKNPQAEGSGRPGGGLHARPRCGFPHPTGLRLSHPPHKRTHKGER